MKTRSLAYLTILVFLFSCAGGPGVLKEPPLWTQSPAVDTEESRAFRGIGTADNIASAKLVAIDALTESVLQAMDLGSPERWTSEGRAAVDAFKASLDQAVRNPEYVEMEGLSVVNKDTWLDDSQVLTFGVDILWESNAFEAKAIELAEFTGAYSPEYRNLENRAKEARSQGNAYESALIWAAAAAVAENDENLSGYRLALRSIETVLDDLNYSIQSVPQNAYVGIRPEEPVIFSISSSGKPVGSAEFFITYPRAARDGSPSVGSARVYSDAAGIVAFRPPEVGFSGSQEVGIAPSADPFLEYLGGATDRITDGFIAAIETPAATAAYQAQTRLREISMGILILETDLAGNPLNSSSASDGLIDDLVLDGFDVDVMDLDPREMVSRTERALLRDLKADTRFSDRYERVLHGTVALESFEQNGDSYSVKVSGTLAMSDINRQVTLYRSEISKTSQASNSQQAITSAFRQLGRSFAAELIALAP